MNKQLIDFQERYRGALEEIKLLESKLAIAVEALEKYATCGYPILHSLNERVAKEALTKIKGKP